jgi:hypothetical protein
MNVGKVASGIGRSSRAVAGSKIETSKIQRLLQQYAHRNGVVVRSLNTVEEKHGAKERGAKEMLAMSWRLTN